MNAVRATAGPGIGMLEGWRLGLAIRSLLNHAMPTSRRNASTERTDGMGPAQTNAASSNTRRKRRVTRESMTWLDRLRKEGEGAVAYGNLNGMPRLARKAPYALTGTPVEHGFSFPPEWYPHRGTWISWPRPEGISFPGRYHEAIEDIAGLIRVLVESEQVHLNVPNENYERIVREFLKARQVPLRRVFFHYIPTNEAWARDHGPAFVLRTKRGKTETAIVDWGFNAWGGKYPPWDADDAVPTRIAEELKLPVFYPGIVMEGGAVDFNGAGTILTTTSCLLNKNRNPQASRRREIEKYLQATTTASGTSCGSARASKATTPTATSTISRASWTNARLRSASRPTSATRTTRSCRKRAARSTRPATRTAARSTSSNCRCQSRWRIDGQRVPATYMNFYFANRGAPGADLRPARSRSEGAGDPSEASAGSRRDRRELPRG